MARHEFKIIDEIGSDAVPYLMEATKPKHDIVSSKFYNAAYAKLPAALAKHLPVPRDAIEIRCRAYRGLQHLGPSAKSAVPFLIQQFNTNNYLLNWVDDTLAMIGPAGKEGIPALSNAFHGPDRTLRVNAARVLARIDPTNPELMLTMLVWLQDTDAIPRRAACLALGELGPAAQPVMPALLEALNDKDEGVRQNAVMALEKIAPEGAAARRPE